MNLHEECLLKYLSNPAGLSSSTELLKQAVNIVEKSVTSGNILAKTAKINYSTNRI